MSFFGVKLTPQRSSSSSGSRRVVSVLFASVTFCSKSVDIFEFLLRKKLKLDKLYIM